MEFICDNKIIEMEIDTESLSETIYRIVSGIATTININPLSEIRIRSHYSLLHLSRIIQENQLLARKIPWITGIVEDFIQEYKALPESMIFDIHPLISWKWDQLREMELPDEYFDRHMQTISEIGYIEWCALETNRVSITQAHEYAVKWGYQISRIGIKDAMQNGRIMNAKKSQGKRGDWEAPISNFVEYLRARDARKK
jgi:hypothetical protein